MSNPHHVRKRNKTLALSGPENRCQFCEKIESKETESLQYAHIIPNKYVGTSIPLENGFALCGNNGSSKLCHYEFDKVIKPILNDLCRSNRCIDWLDAKIDVLGSTKFPHKETLIRDKINNLIGNSYLAHPNTITKDNILTFLDD